MKKPGTKRYDKPTTMRLPKELKAALRAQAKSEGHGNTSLLVIDILTVGLPLRKLELKKRSEQLMQLRKEAGADATVFE